MSKSKDKWQNRSNQSCEKNRQLAWDSNHDSRADVGESSLDPIRSTSGLFDQKSVRNVGRVVDAKADGDDEVDAGHRVDCQTPEVHKATDVDERDNDHYEDQNGADEVTDKNDGGYEDAGDGEADVAIQLF